MDSNYALQVVREVRGGGLVYPKNIPADRGSTALILQIMIIILLWAACTYFAHQRHNTVVEAVKYSWYCTSSNILLIILCSLVWRICNLCEELRHVGARYDDSLGAVFKSALQFNTVSIVIGVLCIASFIGMTVDVGNPLKYLGSFGPETYVCSIITSIFIIRLMNIDESRLDTSLKLTQLKGLDYGSGMAYSYYYGYLDIVLPFRGGQSKGLSENIENYEANNGVVVPVKKLFILIPTSLRTPPDLKEASYNWLESAKALTSVVKTRAGTVDRTYHSTVYIIHPGGQIQGENSVYVVTEGATPLLTFYEVTQNSGKDATSYNDFKKEIAGSFYRTLRDIIKSKPEVRDLCELVYYEDFDPDQKRVNVAKILLDRIQEQLEQ